MSTALFTGRPDSRGFVFSIDAILAVIIVSSAIFVTQSAFFNYQHSSLGQLRQSADDVFSTMQDTGFLFQETDRNSLDNSALSFFWKAKELLPANARLQLKLSQYNLNKEQCRNFKDFEHCFSLVGQSTVGEVLNSEEIAFGRRLIVKKQTPGDCNISAQFSAPAIAFQKPFGIFLSDLNSSDSNVSVQFSVSKAGQVLGKNSTISCDDSLRMDLNAAVKSFGRSSAETMLVMDRSGSMSWTGDAEFNSTYTRVFVDRNYALLARNGGFHDFNVIDPGYPTYVRAVGSGNTSSIFVSNSFAYLTDNTNDQLKIYNASSMSNPSLSGTLSGFTNPLDVSVFGNTAFVADGSSGLRVVNVANKAAPSIISTNPIGTASLVSVDGNTLYAVTSASGSFSVFDTSQGAAQNSSLSVGGYTVDSSEGTSQDSYETIGRNSSNAWAGQSFIPYASTVRNISIYVMKTGTPANDLVVSLRSSISGANLTSVIIPRASITGSYQWIAASFPAAYSVTPASTYFIVLTTAVNSGSNYYRWGANSAEPYIDGTAYQQTTAQSTDAFFRITDSSSTAAQSFVPNSASLQNFSLYVSKTGSPASALTVSLRSSISGADIATVAIPAASVGTSFAWVNASFSSPVAVAPSGTYYFVLSSGSTPSSTAYYNWGSSTANPYSGGTAFKQQSSIASADAFARLVFSLSVGLHAFGISNAPVISYLSSFSTSGATDLFVKDNFAFLARGGNGLQIVNFTDLFSPVLASNFPIAGDISKGVFVLGNFAYVAADNALYEVNVLNKASPMLSRSFETPYGFNAVFVERDFAFLATQGAGLMTIDLLNGEKMNVAKNAGRGFVDFNDWKSNDRIGLVSFSTTATTNRTLLSLSDANKILLKGDINSLVASGSTALGNAMHNARLELTSSRHVAGSLRFEVLMTDGISNAGTFDPVQEARDANAAGIIVYTVGFGPDADAATLAQIASITGGKYYYAGDANSLYTFFQLIAQDIGIISAQSANFSAQEIVLNLPIARGTSISPASITQSRGTHSLDSSALSFSFSDLNRQTPWFGSYDFSFPCNDDAACSSSIKRFPESSSFFQYSISGEPFTVFFDSNSFIDVNFLYRDLEVSFSSAELYDINHLFVTALLSNVGDLNTLNYLSGLTDLNFSVNGSLAGISQVQGLCGLRNSSCSLWFDSKSMELFEEGILAVSIDANAARDCPRGNSATIICRSELLTQFYVLEFGVWD